MSIFGSKHPVHAIGIDIGQSAIKVVQLRLENEKVFLETYGEVELGPYAGKEPGEAVLLGDEKALEALEDLFKAAKITTRNAVLSIDSSSCFISLIQVPNVLDDELRSMIPLEARKYIPIPVDEIQLDFWRIPPKALKEGEEAPKKIDIVLAAVKNTTLEMYERYTTKLGLENPVFEIESFSLVRGSLHGEMKMTMMLDIGSSYTTVTLVDGGSIVDLHVLSNGSQDATKQIASALSIPLASAEEAKRTFGYKGDPSNPFLQEVMKLSSYPLFGEVARLLLMYERKYNQVIEGIIVSGGGARVPGMLPVLHETIQTPARLASPFDQVEVPAFLKDMVTTIGPSYAVACGLALKKLQVR